MGEARFGLCPQRAYSLREMQSSWHEWTCVPSTGLRIVLLTAEQCMQDRAMYKAHRGGFESKRGARCEGGGSALVPG